MPNQYTTTKKCQNCGDVKDNTDFYTKDKKGRRESVCKECKKKAMRDGYDPFVASERWLKTKYGITRADRQKMWEEQGGVCKICGLPGDGKWKQLCVDHDHSTGKVRDLLCRRCNTVLGEVYDDPVVLNKMSDYLKQHA